MLTRLSLLKGLLNAVVAQDGASPKLHWHLINQDRVNPWNLWLLSQNELIAFFAPYLFEKDKVEITGMVHPAYRRKGIAKNFLNEFQLRYPQLRRYLFASSSSENAKCAMESCGAHFSYSEYELVFDLMAYRGSSNLEALHVARLEDLEVLVEIDVLTFSSNRAEIKTQFQKMLHDPSRKVFLFFYKEMAIGKVHSRFCHVTEQAVLHDVCVLPDYQGQGFGKMMLEQVLSYLKSKGMRNVSLEVEAKNKRALSLYERVGFNINKSFNYYSISV